MVDYRQYNPEDFASDESFRNWKINKLPADIDYWERWRKNNPDKEKDLQRAEKLLQAVFSMYNHVTPEELRAEMLILADRANTLKTDSGKSIILKFFNSPLARIAAAIVCAIGIGMLVYFQQAFQDRETLITRNSDVLRSPKSAERIQTNETNKKITILLSDGSTVILSPKSTLTYSDSFNLSTRQVLLSGEAYFEITKDSEHPFYVITDKLITKVIGTSFIVRANPDSQESQVIVRTGVVSVFSTNTSSDTKISQLKNGVLLNPNEQVLLTKQSVLKKSSLSKQELAEMSSSKKLYHFHAAPIAEVFAALEVSYGIKISYDAEVMKKCFLTASLEDEPYLQKMEIICAAIGAKFEQVDLNEIRIISEGCSY